MKNRKYNYTTVEELPANAMLVSDYARLRNCNTAYIYKLAALKRNGTNTKQDTSFDIVIFHGINFIIPS